VAAVAQRGRGAGTPGPGQRRVGRPPGPRRDPAERREVLLDAAVAAIRAHGPDVSVADLAAAAGVTRPILYDHFGDRAGIAAALVHRYTSELASILTPLFARPVSLRDALHDGIDVFCRFVESEPDLYRFLTTARPGEGGVSTGIEIEVGRRVGDALCIALSAAGRDPAIGPIWGYAVLGMVFAAAEGWALTRTVPRRVLVDQLTELITAGLAGAGIAGAMGPFA